MGKLMLAWAAKREANAEMSSWKGNLMANADMGSWKGKLMLTWGAGWGS